MRTSIVLALGLFATQTVGVPLAANVNTDANLKSDLADDKAVKKAQMTLEVTKNMVRDLYVRMDHMEDTLGVKPSIPDPRPDCYYKYLDPKY